MNLVAKEFVAARHDERVFLVLSCFTGAVHELHDALQINPYDVDQTLSDSHRSGDEPEEKESRMRRMRKTVKEHNVYRWQNPHRGTLRAANGCIGRRQRETPSECRWLGMRNMWLYPRSIQA